MSEHWKPIPDHPGYSVSDRGRVRSEQRSFIRRNGVPITINEKLLKPIPDRRGAQTSVYLYRNGRRKNVRPHHLAAELFGAEIDVQPQREAS